jgi:hypothetical protein
MNHLTFLGAWHLWVQVPFDEASPAILQVKDLSLIPVLEVDLLEEFDHRKHQGLNISIVPKSPWLISLCVTLDLSLILTILASSVSLITASMTLLLLL